MRISEEYVKLNRQMHADPRGFGGGGHRWLPNVLYFAGKVGATTLLDYGAGQDTLRTTILKYSHNKQWLESFNSYDPARDELNKEPQPADLVICTDVLEHIEPDCLADVLNHIYELSNKASFLVIATRPAGKNLPDGRNAHLIIEPVSWWEDKIKSVWGHIEVFSEDKFREVVIGAYK